MKRILVILCIAFSFSQLFCQDLPINPATGLVSIIDSVDLKGKSVEQVKEVMANWGHTLLDADNLKQVYNPDNSRNTENIYINLAIGTILTQDRGNNAFFTNGSLSYMQARTTGINKYAPAVGGGGVKFSLIYKVTSSRVIFEITNMEFSSDQVHYGKFESARAPQSNYGASIFFGTSKKDWTRLRVEYFGNLKTLAGYLKQYLTPLISQ